MAEVILLFDMWLEFLVLPDIIEECSEVSVLPSYDHNIAYVSIETHGNCFIVYFVGFLPFGFVFGHYQSPAANLNLVTHTQLVKWFIANFKIY